MDNVMMTKALTVFGFLGTTLDIGGNRNRWERWRPTVVLCQHDDLAVDRLELIFDHPAARLADQVRDDIAHVSPETEVRSHLMPLKDAWDFQEVYAALYDFVRRYGFDTDRE